jgi:surfactin synthase thioesterase subunit
MSVANTDRWLRARRPLARPRLRLLCLAYAGGGATLYHHWPDGLPADVEVRAVQLPGRQDLWGEPPHKSVASLVEGLVKALAGLAPAPLVIYGHSFGAILGFELAVALAAAGSSPRAFIAAARGAAHRPSRLPAIHALPEPAFKEELAARYGMSRALLADAELMALALPALRADFTALETYRFAPGQRLAVPIHALHGRQDKLVPPDDIAAWHELTTGPAALHEVDAGHFFVDTHRPWVLARVGEVLREV